MSKTSLAWPGIQAMRRNTLLPVRWSYMALPVVSPFRPPPVGPYYPLQVRETSRMAVRPDENNDVGRLASGVDGASPRRRRRRASSDQTAPLQCETNAIGAEGTNDAMQVDLVSADTGSRTVLAQGRDGALSTTVRKKKKVMQKRPTPVVPIGTCFTLTMAEAAECARIGRERTAKNAEKPRANRRYTWYRSDDDISIQGVMGEYAFCRLFDLTIDIHDTTCRTARTETRFDAVMMPEAWTVDVKTTIRSGAPLRVTWWKRPNPPHVYALLIYRNFDSSKPLDPRLIEAPVFEFRGFASSATVFAKESRIDTVGSEGEPDIVYVVQQPQLVDRDGLHAELARRGGGSIKHTEPPPLTHL